MHRLHSSINAPGISHHRGKFGRLSILAMIFAGLSCTDLGSDPPLSYFARDIQEAVFRYQFDHNESGQQQGARVYFIGIYVTDDATHQVHYEDLPPDFMARFNGNTPPVKKASQCTQSINGVIDKETGERGLLFRIETIQETGNGEAVVLGGYFEAGLSASGDIYTVRRIDGRWTVVKDVLEWISFLVSPAPATIMPPRC